MKKQEIKKPMVILLFAIFLGWVLMSGPSRDGSIYQTYNYSDLVKAIETKDIESAKVTSLEVTGKTRSGSSFVAAIPLDSDIADRLAASGAKVTIDRNPPGVLSSIIVSLLPIILLIGAMYWLSSRGTGAGRIMGIGKSPAKMMDPERPQVTFADVAGVKEAKFELEEIVEFLKNPNKFQKLGGKIPKGVLLVGPPGTGKTLLAKAVAGEAGVPFFTTSGSSFVEMFVGVGASRVRDLFEEGKKNAPCIIFIDEIDAVGRQRGTGVGGGHDEREQTLNQLLVGMDGFDASEGVIIIAATNRPDVLDAALLRPGRFDRQVVVGLPDVDGRAEILGVHLRKIPMSPNVDVKTIAKGTPGFSGADLANLVNEAALTAARMNRNSVTMNDFEVAKDKVMMGAERKSMAMTTEEKLRTAYHEAGHAILSILVEGNDPLHKVSIVPRGRALGVTISLPDKDRYGYTEKELKARLVMIYGGRVAEEIIYGKENISTGASNDLMQITNMAHKMITEWGMSDKLGALRYADAQEEVFLGRSFSKSQGISPGILEIIDQEKQRIAFEAETMAMKILTENRDKLELLTNALMEFETLSAAESNIAIQGGKIIRHNDHDFKRGSVPTTTPSFSPGESYS